MGNVCAYQRLIIGLCLAVWLGISSALPPPCHASHRVANQKHGFLTQDVGVVNALAYGTGACTAATLNNAISHIGSDTVPLLLSPVTRTNTACTWTLEASVTVPSNIRLWIPHGAMISINAGVVLTIQGPYYAEDPNNWYTGNGTLTVQSTDWDRGRSFKPHIVSGCLPTVPASGLTLPAFACEGYPRDETTETLVYIRQASTAVGPLNAGNGTYWIIVHRNLSSSVAGWTRQSGTHYLWQLAATQPVLPSDTVWAAQVTVAAGNITAVDRPPGFCSNPACQVFRVTDPLFGAKVDGTTNDTTAIQSALNAVPSAGGVVEIPAGTAMVGGGSFSGLQVSAGTTVRGAGVDTTILKLVASSDTTHNAILVLGGDNITVQDLTLNGNRANQSYAAVDSQQNLVYGAGRTDIRVHGTRLTATRRHGIYLLDPQRVWIESNRIDTNDYHGVILQRSTGICTNLLIANNDIGSNGNATDDDGTGIGVLGDSTNNVYCTYVKILGNTLYSNRRNGVYLSGTRYATVAGNVVHSNNAHATVAYGILMTMETQYTSITGNTLYNNRDGIGIDTSNGGNVYGDHVVAGNLSDSNLQSGIRVQGTPNVTVVGNVSRGNGNYGVLLSDADQPRVKDNTIDNNTVHGINMASTSITIAGAHIEGNMIRANGNGTANYGGINLSVSGSGGIASPVFRNNLFSGNNPDGFFVQTGAPTLITLVNNDFQATVSNAIGSLGLATVLRQADNTGLPIVSVATLGDGFTISPAGQSLVRLAVTGDTASRTSSATTAIADGTYPAQLVILCNADTDGGTNEVIIQNGANTVNNGAASITLGKNDCVHYLWNGTDWFQTSAVSNN